MTAARAHRRAPPGVISRCTDESRRRSGNLHVFEVKNGTGRLTQNQAASGAFDMSNPANQNGAITTGNSQNFTVATDNRPNVGPRNSTQSASFNVLKYDV